MARREGRRIRSKTARMMLSLRHYEFRQRLKWKAWQLGALVLEVNEAYTSKTRSWDGSVKALSDAGMSSLLSQIRYKARWYGTTVVEADWWYPSSKTCPACGEDNAELGRQPHWLCPYCGVNHDRNQNAARNLRKLALLAVGEDVMRLDGGALAGDGAVAGETAPDEGRTKPRATEDSQLMLAL